MKLKNKKAFTLPEAIIVLIIIGVIGLLYNTLIKLPEHQQKGFEVQSQKILENFDQVFTLIFAKHSESFNLEDLHDKDGNFSITDKNIMPRFVNFFKENLNVITLNDGEFKKVKEYYSSTLLNYDRTSTGLILNKTYSEFINTQNGTIYGFRLYEKCSANETNTYMPKKKNKITVKNICGSIFYDVNNYKGPNKLGSDQYIVPFDNLGIELKAAQ